MTCTYLKLNGGADRDRTDDLLNAIQALSQLSYSPTERNHVSIASAKIRCQADLKPQMHPEYVLFAACPAQNEY